jgi:hypothetical protein
MTEPSADRDDPAADRSSGPGSVPVAGTPRWVKVLGVLVLLLVLIVVVLHLTGNGPGGPGSHLGLAVAGGALAAVQVAARPC